MKPMISVVIPCYNNVAYIEKAVVSVIDQTYPYTEIIVIDDGSTDNSVEVIGSLANRHAGQIYWETGNNLGAPVARNRGLELTKGEFVKFLDADDILVPNCLERQVAQAIELQIDRKAIVYGDVLWVDYQGKSLPGYPHCPRQADEEPIAHILANSPLTSSPLHRRDYLLEIGGFDPSVHKGQEHDLHLRLVLAGVEFVYHPGPVYKYREHNASGRISNHAYSSKGPLVHYHTLQKQVKLIEAKTQKPLSPQVSRVLAQHFWAYGRGILREGYETEARTYFEAARKLDTHRCISGRWPYPQIVRLCGPYQAEKLQSGLRKFVKRNSA